MFVVPRAAARRAQPAHDIHQRIQGKRFLAGRAGRHVNAGQMIKIRPSVQFIEWHRVQGFFRQAEMAGHHDQGFIFQPFHQVQFQFGGNERIEHLGDDQSGRQIRRQRRHFLCIHNGQANLGINAQAVAQQFKKTHPRQNSQRHLRVLRSHPNQAHRFFSHHRTARHGEDNILSGLRPIQHIRGDRRINGIKIVALLII